MKQDGSIEAQETEPGFPKVILRHHSGSSAEVYLHGATVTSWRTPAAGEVLFLSSKAVFQPGKALRGGIPVVFPQFSGQGPLPAHGIARNVPWTIAEKSVTPFGDIRVTLKLTDSPESRRHWEHAFEMRFTVTLGETLTTGWRITNLNPHAAFTFQNALHTYFTVGSIEETRVEGLKGLRYLDNTSGGATGHEARDSITFDGEVDRIYCDTPPAVLIRDPKLGRTITVHKEQLRDSVVWNPWIEKARKLADLADEEFRQFVCVESGNVEHPIPLEPSQEFSCVQQITVHTGS